MPCRGMNQTNRLAISAAAEQPQYAMCIVCTEGYSRPCTVTDVAETSAAIAAVETAVPNIRHNVFTPFADAV